ncbi:MAG TPA: iron-containing alcohol dehydrogenase, partial [Polyangiaceae bacterium]|nr:iron-containing alcohol dehydrogenase [Polyangiaceae bacterium]
GRAVTYSSASELLQPRIDYGGLRALSGVLRAAARRRIFVVQGVGARYSERLALELGGFEVQWFCEARRHVPRELVDRAARQLGSWGADTVLSVGGGSATGLGKALRLEHEFYFVAVPTTYAGSELTNLYGITSASGKKTGRDARVMPNVVLYDVGLTLDMPPVLSMTSLMNALSHPLSALSTAALEPARFEAALEAASTACRAIVGLLRDPRSSSGRHTAFEATVAAARVLASSPVGIHHQLAHLLGGRFDLDHAGLHSVLLPHSLDWMAKQSPTIHAAVVSRLGNAELSASLLDWLREVGASTSLQALGVAREPFQELLEAHPELPRSVLQAAYAGQRG